VCGIVSFKYDRQIGDFLYSGENYNKYGVTVSVFSVRDIVYDNRINGFRYWGSVKQQGDSSYGSYGELTFIETGKRSIESGQGMFVNNAKTIVRAKFSTERLYNEDGKPHKLRSGLHTEQQRGEFAISKLSKKTNKE